MTNTDELKDAITAMYRVALEGCTTREQCMDLHRDIHQMITRLRRIANEDCYARANEIEREGRS